MAIHQFGSGNTKIKQRFRLGSGVPFARRIERATERFRKRHRNLFHRFISTQIIQSHLTTGARELRCRPLQQSVGLTHRADWRWNQTMASSILIHASIDRPVRTNHAHDAVETQAKYDGWTFGHDTVTRFPASSFNSFSIPYGCPALLIARPLLCVSTALSGPSKGLVGFFAGVTFVTDQNSPIALNYEHG